MKIENPHDKFFKKTFGNVDVAKDFLKNYLPPSIMGIIDIDTLEAQKDSHIDKELQESFSDLLFKATINNREGYLYLLFEHKSYPSRDIVLQLLKYMVNIWDVKYKEIGRIPVVIPLVIYHGKRSWNISRNLSDMILSYDGLPQDVKALIPNYKYLLYDLSEFTDEEIKGEVINRIAIKITRDIQRKGIGAILEIALEAAALMQQFEDKDTGLEYFETLIRYIFSARSDLTRKRYDEFIEKVETTYPEGSEMVMTLAQLFREEGKEEGLLKGIEKGETEALQRTVLKLLTKKFGFIPEEIKTKISQLDAPTLEVMIDGILDYGNLEDVKRYLQ